MSFFGSVKESLLAARTRLGAMRGLFGRRRDDVASTAGDVNSPPATDANVARHEAAANAVLSSMRSNPPLIPTYVDPQHAPKSSTIASVSPGEMRALQMPDLPPHPDMPVRGGNLGAVRGEDQFEEMMNTQTRGKKGKLIVVNFGASWCTHCASLLPVFGDASREYPDAHFVLADVDTLPETAEHIRFTPTFSFWRDGRKIDEVSKIKARDFLDRMWLHAGVDQVK